MSWIKGMPSVVEVQEHSNNYPVADGGGVWLVMHDHSPFGPYASLVRLRPAKMGDSYITTVSENGKDQTMRVHLLPGTVLLQNGFSFWQPLELCKWVETSRFRPCTPEGLPTDYVDTSGMI